MDEAALLARLAALDGEERGRMLRQLSPTDLEALRRRWTLWAHQGQLAPAGEAWRVWLIRAGRGFGKTRAGAEWVSEVARANPEAHIALVGATRKDAREVMVEGPSGVLAVAGEAERPAWTPSTGEVRFPGGAVAQVYGAMAAEGLRGPQHHFAWADELGKWRGRRGWDNLMLGLRGGVRPRCVVTTTPRATELMRLVMAADGTVETRGTTADNPHLPDSFVAAMTASYGGTRLGRQELHGEMLDDVAGALWPRWLIERQRVAAAPTLARVVIGVDPTASAGGDTCGIVAAGVESSAPDARGYVLEDASVSGASPEGWARAVAACARRHRAERVVAEKNNGGEMVESVLRAARSTLSIRLVHASRGKSARAERWRRSTSRAACGTRACSPSWRRSWRGCRRRAATRGRGGRRTARTLACGR